MKKVIAMVLALVLVLTMGATATAVDLQENLEEGVAGNWNTADSERTQSKSINIKKVIKAYNANATHVNAPVITYTYTVTPATVSSFTVTDANSDHISETAVVAPVNAGLTSGLVVTGANAAGTAVNGSAGDDTSATATLVFDNTSTWTTAADGGNNEYDITLNFSGVTFSKPGVYRYQITETVSPEYDKAAMKDGDYNTVYLDVYVDGDLAIYGYVCMKSNNSVTDTTKKINGFVDSSDGDGTDKYYTYDLTLSKDVVKDTFGTNHAFPFTVIFGNEESYTSTFTIGQDVGNGSTGLTTLTGLPNDWNGVALVKMGGNITIKGIPAGVDVDVYETNDMTGVTYTVATSVNGGTATTDNNVSSGSAPGTATAQAAAKAAYESKKVTVNTEKNASVATTQTVAITNTLLLISPTGVVMRVAPYALILIAGIALLLISRRRKAVEEE